MMSPLIGSENHSVSLCVCVNDCSLFTQIMLSSGGNLIIAVLRLSPCSNFKWKNTTSGVPADVPHPLNKIFITDLWLFVADIYA